METIHVDCGTCSVRGRACSDCVITVLLGVPRVGAVEVDLAPEEREALAALASSGLLPPLRMTDGHADLSAQTEIVPRFTERFAE